MQVKTKTKKGTFRNRNSAIVIAAALILVAGFFTYHHFRHNSKQPKTLTAVNGQVIDLSPATTSDKKETDEHKRELANSGSTPSVDSSGSPQKKQAAIVITDASETGVNGYATGIFEDGGTCTATAIQGSTKVSKTSSGFENVSYTQCSPITWNAPLAKGTWAISLNYDSTAAQGTLSKTIEVK